MQRRPSRRRGGRRGSARAPAPVSNEDLFRGNLQGIRVRTRRGARRYAAGQAVPRNAGSPSQSSRDMESAAPGRRFRAGEPLRRRTARTSRRVQACDRRAREACESGSDAQAAFEARYAQSEWEIASAIEYKTSDVEASSIQDELLREKERMDLAVLEANFVVCERPAGRDRRLARSIPGCAEEAPPGDVRSSGSRTPPSATMKQTSAASRLVWAPLPNSTADRSSHSPISSSESARAAPDSRSSLPPKRRTTPRRTGSSKS